MKSKRISALALIKLHETYVYKCQKIFHHPRPFILSKGIDFDSFSRKNNENSQKLENCPKIRGLLPVTLEILPKSEYGKFIC